MAMANTGAMQLVGAAQVHTLLAAYPVMVQKAAERTGMRKSSKVLAMYLQQAAPAKTGMLRKAMRVKKVRAPRGLLKYQVGLRSAKGESKVRFYYKTLELQSKRGAPLHPFFMQTWEAHKVEIAQLIVDNTRQAVYDEAARIYRRTMGLKKKRGR